MSDPQFSIEPVRPWDMWTLTRMAYANMTGVDREFTRSTSGPVSRALGYFILPLYLLTSGRGYKATVGGEIVGCAFLNMRRLSGFVYNVNVNAAYRRKGIGRALMEHLEREVRRLGRSWVCLFVDDGNTPAQQLYQSLSYHSYHYQFLRSHSPETLFALQNHELRARKLARAEGQHKWKLYIDLARREGDAWAARPVREDFDEGPPTGGAFWSCRLDNTELGCLWAGGRATWPVVKLLLRQEVWDDGAAHLSLLGQVLEAYAVPLDTVDLHLGSSAHHEAVFPLLQPFGFQAYNRPRILMLKQLEPV